MRSGLPVAFSMSLLLSFATTAKAGSPFQPPSTTAPQIRGAEVVNGDLVITGANFGTASAPVVVLGGSQLTVTDSASDHITASVAASLGAGSYPLWVLTSASTQWMSLDVTVGAVGPQGPAGPEGPAGPAGPSPTVTKVIGATLPVSPGGHTFGKSYAMCPPGQHILSGGYVRREGTSFPGAFVTLQNGPYTDPARGLEGWIVEIASATVDADPRGTGVDDLLVYGFCIAAP